jgi:hypothetical protein
LYLRGITFLSDTPHLESLIPLVSSYISYHRRKAVAALVDSNASSSLSAVADLRTAYEEGIEIVLSRMCIIFLSFFRSFFREGALLVLIFVCVVCVECPAGDPYLRLETLWIEDEVCIQFSAPFYSFLFIPSLPLCKS